MYDEASRVVGVTDTVASQAVEYRYDEAGNILAVVVAGAVALFESTPDRGPVGSEVTLFGKGFSATAGQNTVKFNGVTASVAMASTDQLVVTVPAGATAGQIRVITSL